MLEDFGKCKEVKDLAGRMFKPGGDVVEAGLRDAGQVDVLGQVFACQTIGVFVVGALIPAVPVIGGLASEYVPSGDSWVELVPIRKPGTRLPPRARSMRCGCARRRCASGCLCTSPHGRAQIVR